MINIKKTLQLLQLLFAKALKKCRGISVRSSEIHKTAKIDSGSNILGSSIGRYSFCGYDCEIIYANIGSFCSIANGVIIGGAKHPMKWVSMSPVFYAGRDSVNIKFSFHQLDKPKITNIGHDVWIGRNALIKEGLTIGTGAVIGMGSVVTKDVPPYAIVGGSPAKIIRYRFDDLMISKLLDSNWWSLDEHSLEKYSEYVTDPCKFISEINS